MKKETNAKSKKNKNTFDTVKGFVSKLINPSVDELGLLMHEQVSLWRFQNQIRILKKAQNICKNNNISTKVIPPKLLSPFLEKSSLEDDEFLQEKWTNLFVNMIDSKQNIQNHVFPYILSQLSKDEYSYLESKILDKKQKNIELKKELLDLEKIKSQKKKN